MPSMGGLVMSDSKTSGGRNYIVSSISGLIFAGLVGIWWTDIWPWKFMAPWESKGELADWLNIGIPMFIWALAVSFLFDILRDTRSLQYMRLLRDASPAQVFSIGVIRSLWAGITEEIAFRWILPYTAIPGLLLINWLFFGFAGFGLNEWFHTTIWSPFANLTTLGHLETSLLAENWVIGACMLYTNAFFRDGHKYQGALGWINSWFLGMYLWFICLNYGLIAAIIVHVLYDLIIYTHAAIYIAVRKVMK